MIQGVQVLFFNASEFWKSMYLYFTMLKTNAKTPSKAQKQHRRTFQSQIYCMETILRGQKHVSLTDFNVYKYSLVVKSNDELLCMQKHCTKPKPAVSYVNTFVIMNQGLVCYTTVHNKTIFLCIFAGCLLQLWLL